MRSLRFLIVGLGLLGVAHAAVTSPFPTRNKYAGGAVAQYAYMYNYYLPPTASTPWRPAWSPDGKELRRGQALLIAVKP